MVIQTTIREAQEGDFEFVVELMNGALAPFYDGDHRAHAARIFTTHMEGGRDKVGHFSFEQRMFAMEVEGQPAGIVNIVGKRQGTYKISPLIVAEPFKAKHGVGSQLLAHAEHYARRHEARQIYCTVAAQNNAALQFFLRKGYVPAGRSESHYKAGITEVMLYKLFLNPAFQKELDRPNISVLPMRDEHEEQCRRLIASILPKHFDGITEEWLDALFEGYRRRHTNDVNEKYKLIFVAIDRSNTVLGVVGATPKKGEPVKLMPLVAPSFQAFTAILTDIPNLLKMYGRKIYMHIVPTVEQTIALQRQGWTLDAAMPGAYSDTYVTQQWGLTIGDNFMRNMRVKQHFFDFIKSRQKPLEVRVGYDNITQIQVGERIRLSTHMKEQIIRVNAVRKYPTFKEMLEVEDPNHISPGCSKEEVLDLLKHLYPQEKERLGVHVLEIEPVN